jgi:hypothetical protein
MSRWSPPPPSIGNADNLLIQTDELSNSGVAMIAYVVPSKSPQSLLVTNGVARNYSLLLARTGRTIDEFRTYCEGSHLQRQMKDVEEVQVDRSATLRRDAMRKTVNVKLLELLSKFSTKLSGCRTQQTDPVTRQFPWNQPQVR